jgi:hypothetical protein
MEQTPNPTPAALNGELNANIAVVASPDGAARAVASMVTLDISPAEIPAA